MKPDIHGFGGGCRLGPGGEGPEWCGQKKVDLGSCLDNRCGLQEQFKGPWVYSTAFCGYYNPAMGWLSCEWIQEELEYNTARSLERRLVEYLNPPTKYCARSQLPDSQAPPPPGMILILAWKDRDAARPHDEERGRRGMLC